MDSCYRHYYYLMQSLSSITVINYQTFADPLLTDLTTAMSEILKLQWPETDCGNAQFSVVLPTGMTNDQVKVQITNEVPYLYVKVDDRTLASSTAHSIQITATYASTAKSYTGTV